MASLSIGMRLLLILPVILIKLSRFFNLNAIRMDELQVREWIVECGRRLHQKGFVAANDGNISVKFNNHEILATPTGISKGFLKTDDLIVLDLKGNILSGSRKPSSEIQMHLVIYDERTDARAVVHAHPVYATGFATSNTALQECVLAEIVTTLGSIPLVPYATPSTRELADTLRPYIRSADACLLANHGVVTCGKDLDDAYFKMERVEHYAQILFVAKLLGGSRTLNREEVEKLVRVRATYGTENNPSPGCLTCEGDCVGGDCTLYKNRSGSKPSDAEGSNLSALIKEIILSNVHAQ